MRKNDVKVLSEIEHVLHRPGMYVGDTTLGSHQKWVMEEGKILKKKVKIVPAFLKLFDEIISNCIDEGFRTDFKYANEIKVRVEDNGKITIEDNGRGIPVVSTKDGKTQAEQAFTNLRAGANFDDGVGNVSIGTHGLGSTLVNILSKKFIAHTDDGKKHFRLQCSKNMSEIDTIITKSNGVKGTMVSYFADFDRLGMNTIDGDHMGLLEKRVNDLAVCFPQIRFKYNGRLVKSAKFRDYLSKIGSEFVAHETDNYSVAVLPSDDGNFISFVNGIDTFGGGVHCDVVSLSIASALRDSIKRKHRLDIRIPDIKNKLLFVIVTNKVSDPKFDSQTKERLTNNDKDIKPIFAGVNDEKFIARIMKNEEVIQPIIEALLLKKQLAEARALRKAQKTAKKKKVANHISAIGKNPEDKILFITEGQSAISNLINVRQTAIHGGYPLRGKVKNVRQIKPTDIMKNKELSELMSIIGLELGETATDLNYGQIGILADADFDGFSIAAALVNFFSYWKELFDEERLLFIKSPIVIAKKKKQVKRFYDLKDFSDAKLDSDWKIEYNKGLGSLSIEEYDLMINDPVTEVIKFDDEATRSLETVFGKDSLPRKKWLMK
jgi:DNA gyrase/topoisomerase IV subunit B